MMTLRARRDGWGTGRRGARRAVVAGAVSAALVVAAGGTSAVADPTASPAATPGVPPAIQAILDQPQYKNATWSLLAVDLTTGQQLAGLHADQLQFTGSTRKLFSVGLALKQLGADATADTKVYRSGNVDAAGVLHGDLDFLGAGDLTLGGRRISPTKIKYTDFDHNDANNLGTAILTPQDPLAGVKALAAQVKASGITRVDGDVVIDERLFTPYRVPNQQLLITPTMLNEDQVDVTVTPTTPGQPARIDYRPHTPGFAVTGTVMTTAAGTTADVQIPLGTTPAGQQVKGVVNCVGQPNCTGTISGTIPVDYKAPLSGEPQFVGTFRIDSPENFARTAFVAALQHAGVQVAAPAVEENPTAKVPTGDYYPSQQVASFVSPPFAQEAQLILKVSLNLGANLALTKYGLTQGATTIQGALAAERRALIALGIPGDAFDFPTNGSGSPDSKASARAIVDMLAAMSTTPVADVYRNALPLLGVNGSLAGTGTTLSGKGHIHGKTGTTVEAPNNLVAQNLAGYVDAKSGHRIAYAVVLNNFGALTDLSQVLQILEDEARVANVLYEKY